MSERQRDYQISRVYAAEAGFAGYEFVSVDAVRSYCDRILRSAWWRKRSAIRHIEYRTMSRYRWYAADRKGEARGKDDKAFVRLRGDVKGHDQATILHELAHILTDDTEPTHGRVFCQNELALILKWMSPEAENDLRARLIANDVEF
jgi:putative metallohydrolase (TIGR04338 family)